MTLVNLPYSTHPGWPADLMALAALSFNVRPPPGGAEGVLGPRLRLTRCTLVLPDEEVAFLRRRAQVAGAAAGDAGLEAVAEGPAAAPSTGRARAAAERPRALFTTGAVEEGSFFQLNLQVAEPPTARADMLAVERLELQPAVLLLNCTLIAATAYAALSGAVPLLPQSRVWPPLLLHGNRTRALSEGPSGLSLAPGMEAALASHDRMCGQMPGGATVTFIARRHDDTVLSEGQDPEGGITAGGGEDGLSPPGPVTGDACTVSGYAPELVGGRTFTDLKGAAGRRGLEVPLRLRNLVLYNLAPGGSDEALLEGDAAAWTNTSLPLWYFKLPRSASPDDPAPLLLLDNVTLVVPEPEWRALAAAVLAQHTQHALAAAQRTSLPLPQAFAPPSPSLPPFPGLLLPALSSPPSSSPASPPSSRPFPPSSDARSVLLAFAAASTPLSLDTSSGVLVLASARHYGWRGTHVTITFTLPPDAPPGASLLPYPELRLPYLELAVSQALVQRVAARMGGDQSSGQQAEGDMKPMAASSLSSSNPGASAAAPLDDGTFLQEVSMYFCELRDRLERHEGLGVAAAQCAMAEEAQGGLLQAAIRELKAELGDSTDLNVTSVLGRGAFGVVYAGRWRSLPVAVKVLVVTDVDAGSEGRKRQQAMLETAISLSMAHENVVGTYTYMLKPLVQQPVSAQQGVGGESCSTPGTHDDLCDGGGSGLEQGPAGATPDAYKLYIVQELCNGGSLRQALSKGMVGGVRNGGLGQLLSLRLALDVARGVAHVHVCRIVHGDLKPDNVLLVVADTDDASLGAVASGPASGAAPVREVGLPALTAKVADFGLSLPLPEDATHQSKRYHGTPSRTAPEVAVHGQLSPHSDVWSYGTMLIEFFYGCTFESIASTYANMMGAQAQPDTGGGRLNLHDKYRELRTMLLEVLLAVP
ncbi:hypothetical protein GPECTOR_119g394 [Gonium pectorale]|uniref:Protein kinase domain-containing protein n=1 Tax=Gonium pectorale TaxID=33097 RepID=A0A150FYS3_GONPE|nr:hypothetical protein GPECTOR_119g394 [Gonium pectorale]|eukprot:KXZ42763.1 hypothetical protein GPECTOR_119g394 [Gonium pectorale]